MNDHNIWIQITKNLHANMKDGAVEYIVREEKTRTLILIRNFRKEKANEGVVHIAWRLTRDGVLSRAPDAFPKGRPQYEECATSIQRDIFLQEFITHVSKIMQMT